MFVLQLLQSQMWFVKGHQSLFSWIALIGFANFVTLTGISGCFFPEWESCEKLDC